MPVIAPVSELRNYGQVLEKVKPNAPVYLTKNGHGQFSVHCIEDELLSPVRVTSLISRKMWMSLIFHSVIKRWNR